MALHTAALIGIFIPEHPPGRLHISGILYAASAPTGWQETKTWLKSTVPK